jgi:hypothetical protein
MAADPARGADPEWVVLTLTASLLRPGARREGATLILPCRLIQHASGVKKR